MEGVGVSGFGAICWNIRHDSVRGDRRAGLAMDIVLNDNFNEDWLLHAPCLEHEARAVPRFGGKWPAHDARLILPVRMSIYFSRRATGTLESNQETAR